MSNYILIYYQTLFILVINIDVSITRFLYKNYLMLQNTVLQLVNFK